MAILMGNVGGTYDEVDWSLEDPLCGVRTVTRYVKFSVPFPNEPSVIMGITKLDAGATTNLRVNVEAADVTTTGFNARFTTWDDSVTFGVSASWIAVGE